MKQTQPTYSPRYTAQDMDALYGTRPATSTVQSVRCPDGYTRYTLQSGDTLSRLAETYGVTVTELLFYNPTLNPYGYAAGDVICVPGTASDTPASPDEGPTELPTPSVPTEDETPASPDEGSVELPTPSVPSEDETPASPDEGSVELPTPSIPTEDETPASPDEGPIQLPTPDLPATPVIPECSDGVLYTVQSGDTLRSIAQRFDVTLDALLAANPAQSGNRLTIGQKLCIPRTACSSCCAANTTSVRIRSTDFVDYLVTYNISYSALAAANPGTDLNRLIPGRELCIPPAGSRGSCAEDVGTLELPRTMTLATLAQQLRTSMAQLLRYNPTYTPTDFTMGRIICVPPARN